MIATSAQSLVKASIIPPEPKANISLELSNGSIMYTWNKTAWLVDQSGKVVFELCSSSPLTSIAFNSVDMLAIGDSKGLIKIYHFTITGGLVERPLMESQALNTDIQKLVFCSRDVLAVGGGLANQSCRQFMAIIRIVETAKEFKLMCDGTGGPTKPVNDVAYVDGMVAFASDDRSVTIFKINDKAALFYKAYSDYGGLVGRVIFSEDGQYIGYGSGGSGGKFLTRSVDSDVPPEEHILAHPSGKIYFDSGNIKSAEYTNRCDGTKGVIKTVLSKQDKLQAFDHVGTQVYTLPAHGILGGIETTNDSFVAKVDGRRIVVYRRDNGQSIRTSGWSSHDSVITSLVFLDSKRLISVGLDGHLFVWNVEVPLKPVAGLTHAHHGPINNVAVLDETKIVTFGQEDGTIRSFHLVESP